MAGIVLVVIVLVIFLLSVAMDHVMVMKLMKHVQQIVMHQVSVLMAQSRTVMALMSAGETHGLEMDYVMAIAKNGVQTFVATIMMVVTVLMLNVKAVQTLRAGMVVAPILKLIVQIWETS
jgi:hypothetical protein